MMPMLKFEGDTRCYDDWQLVVESLPDQKAALSAVNRARTQSILIRANGKDWYVPRVDVKQFLEDSIEQQ
jgi:hypothetical protein